MKDIWCQQCQAVVEVDVDEANGFTACMQCGAVLDDHVFSSDPTFLKTPTGTSQVQGNFVPERGFTPTLTRGPRGALALSFHVSQPRATPPSFCASRRHPPLPSRQKKMKMKKVCCLTLGATLIPAPLLHS